MTEEIRLTIGVPTSGFVRSAFSHSLANMMGHLCSVGIKSEGSKTLTILLEMLESSVIHSSRETLADKALAADATHLMFLDDDMVFEPDILDTLISRHLPIVLTNYLLKVDDPKFLCTDKNGQGVSTFEHSTGIQPVNAGGFGVSLFETEVFKKTPKPWFLPLYVAEAKGYTTEDVAFFYRTRKAGFEAFVDHDASKKVSHVGNKRWNWKEYKHGTVSS
jgi:hypothetical protein